MQNLRYRHEEVVWIEVPGEVSLAYQFTGCPLRCKGCHSADTWKVNSGQLLSLDYFSQRLQQYKHLISCVLFMGGEWLSEQLVPYLQLAKDNNLKTCLYTGLEKEQVPTQLLPLLDYLKTGPWIPELGGLDNPNSNQRFIDMQSGNLLNHLFHKN
ncbi:MAG: anaerobic ribonucleoside-triphosphate reductase activating protein [Alcaligenaceae bacterium]|nr:anaerobic ribonucleoside-triphosphate reductase activating protein [Alcaligenaceae bacterium]